MARLTLVSVNATSQHPPPARHSIPITHTPHIKPILSAGRALARMAIEEMVVGEAEEVVLEAEVTNTGALALYRSLGFIRDKHLHR